MANEVTNIITMKNIADENLFSYFKYIGYMDTKMVYKKEKDSILEFDFNKIVKFPRILEYTNGMSDTEIDKLFKEFGITHSNLASMYYKFKTKNIKIPKSIMNNPMYYYIFRIGLISNIYDFYRFRNNIHNDKSIDITEDIARRAISIYIYSRLKYDCNDWHSWCTKYWGSKWNACKTKIISNDKIGFTTAWQEPLPIFIALSKMFPNRRIITESVDEFLGFANSYELLNGRLKIKYAYTAEENDSFEKTNKMVEINNKIFEEYK